MSVQNYLIIGASSGIGKSLANLLVNTGHNVYATYSSNPQDSNSPSLKYHALNVLDDYINLDYLPDTLSGLVYCPGSINLKPFARITPKEFIEDFNLQAVGAIKVIQSVLPKLKASKSASIVLFSTIAVQTGFNLHSQVATSKGAIEGLTRSLAAELAPRIRVNCIAPSITDTPLALKILSSYDKKEASAQRHPLKKIGDPADHAEISAFLLSDKASWITGQILHVDGGLSAIKI